jgi:hypothetical protein
MTMTKRGLIKSAGAAALAAALQTVTTAPGLAQGQPLVP